MTNPEKEALNKFIHTHKNLFDSCWHENKWGMIMEFICEKCGKDVERKYKLSEPANPDYTHHSMFMTVWEKIKDQDWFEELLFSKIWKNPRKMDFSFINSRRLVELVRDFLIEKEASHD